MIGVSQLVVESDTDNLENVPTSSVLLLLLFLCSESLPLPKLVGFLGFWRTGNLADSCLLGRKDVCEGLIGDLWFDWSFCYAPCGPRLLCLGPGRSVLPLNDLC